MPSDPPSALRLSFASGQTAVRQVPCLPSTYSGPPPPPPIPPPASTNRGSVARTRSATTPSSSRFQHGDDTDPRHHTTRTSPPHPPLPGASRPIPSQHHPRKKEPSATSNAVRAFPVRFAYQSKYRGQHTPGYQQGVDSKARFECLCIQWRRRTMDSGIPPLQISFEACFGNWHGRDMQSLCCFSRIQATQRQDPQLSGDC